MEEQIKVGTIQSSVAPQGDSLEAFIRQIVREEIAAHEERRHKEIREFLAATEGLVGGTSQSRE